VAEELGHEALAEAHDFIVALAFGVEIGAALAAAHRQRGQRVLEDLLEAEELQNAEGDRGVETQAPLIGADGAVELHAIAPVHLHFSAVIHPRHAK